MCVLRALDFSRYKDFGDLSKFCEYVRMRHNSRRFLELIWLSALVFYHDVAFFGKMSRHKVTLIRMTRNLKKNIIKSTRSFARQDALNTRKENLTRYLSTFHCTYQKIKKKLQIQKFFSLSWNNSRIQCNEV